VFHRDSEDDGLKAGSLKVRTRCILLVEDQVALLVFMLIFYACLIEVGSWMAFTNVLSDNGRPNRSRCSPGF